MFGPIAITVVLLVLIPVGVIMTGLAVAGLLGMFLQKDVDEEFEGTEYEALSRFYDEPATDAG